LALPDGEARNRRVTENFHILITSLSIRGKMRHVAMTVPRFGEFFIFDAKPANCSRASRSAADRQASRAADARSKTRNAAATTGGP